MSSKNVRKPDMAIFVMTLLGLVAIPAAHADAVDIVGGFYAYAGPLVKPNIHGFRTSFDVPGLGVIIGSPTEAIPGLDYAWSVGYGQGVVPLTTTGSDGQLVPASSVEFFRDTDVNPPVRNKIAFTPSTNLDLSVGEIFKIGTFTFTNGTWLGDLPDSTFRFSAHTVSDTAALNGHDLNASITFHVTTGCTADYSTCTTDPVANADYFHIVPEPDGTNSQVELGFVGVYEPGFLPPGLSNTGSIDLYGRIGSLVPTALLNPQGVTLQLSIPTVPEPQVWLMTMAGLAVASGVVRRKAQRT